MILEFTKQQKEEDTILVFNVTQLGTEATMRTFDLTAVSYLKKISLDQRKTTIPDKPDSIWLDKIIQLSEEIGDIIFLQHKSFPK